LFDLTIERQQTRFARRASTLTCFAARHALEGQCRPSPIGQTIFGAELPVVFEILVTPLLDQISGGFVAMEER
jgi:hypothetical protein